RITLFRPGHKPPQVTMPARVRVGSKNNLSRGPASSNSTSSRAGTAGSRTISAGIRAWSLTACRTGEGNRASPREVMFMGLISFVRLEEVRDATPRACGLATGSRPNALDDVRSPIGVSLVWSQRPSWPLLQCPQQQIQQQEARQS